MSQGFDRERLVELAGRLCDEQITPDEVAELEAVLKPYADARKLFHLTVALHRDLGLCEIAPEQDVANDTSTKPAIASMPGELVSSSAAPEADERQTSARRSLLTSRLALASVVFLVVMSIGYFIFRSDDRNADPNSVADFAATITHLADVVWAEDQPAFSVGDSVNTQRLRIDAGSVRLIYSHGVVTTIEGPADVEFVSSDRAILHFGQQVAYVPEGAEGFRVDTPTAGVVDLGTEFGVTVAKTGETELSVFDGKVELTPRLSTSAASDAKKEVVSAGQARRVDRQGRSTPFTLQPYKDARDALRGWQIIWEPFGPGSETGRFPGSAGAGWQGQWEVDVVNGVPDRERTGIFASRKLNDARFRVGKPLHPGAEYFYRVVTTSQEDQRQRPIRLRVHRPFGPIDEFTTSRPYTIEFLVRLESKPGSIESFHAFGKPASANDTDPFAWQLQAVAEDDGMMWQLPGPDEAMLPFQEQQSVRCFVEVDPIASNWRATIASRTNSATIDSPNGIALTNSADGNMVLGFEAIGSGPEPVGFSIDGIRIQNHPTAESPAATR